MIDVSCLFWQSSHVAQLGETQGRMLLCCRADVCCRVRAAGPHIGALLQGAAELALMLSAASSGIMGISVAVVELKRGAHRLPAGPAAQRRCSLAFLASMYARCSRHAPDSHTQ